MLQKNVFKNKMFLFASRIMSALSSIPNTVTPAPFRLMQIGSLFWQSRALNLTVKLGIADHLSNTEISSKEIADRLNLFEPHLYRLMRFMAALGVFKEASHRNFVHSKLSRSLVKGSPNNVCDMILLHNSIEMTQPWMDALEKSMSSGAVPFAECHGSDMFSYLGEHHKLDNLFSNAMNTVEALTGLEYLQDFSWGSFSHIFDLGGSKGSKSLSILANHPQLTATIFDRPEVVKDAKLSWKNKVNKDILDRIDYIGGDLFTSPLPAPASDTDAYLLIAVFHLLCDEDAATLIRRICGAMGNINSTIIIADMVLPETGASITEASFDMQMLMGTNGGERTAEQWAQVFKLANVYLLESVSIQSFGKMLVLKRSDYS